MGNHISTEKGFMDHFVGNRVDPEGFLSRVDRLVDWSPLERFLKKHYKKKAAAGQEGHVPEDYRSSRRVSGAYNNHNSGHLI